MNEKRQLTLALKEFTCVSLLKDSWLVWSTKGGFFFLFTGAFSLLFFCNHFERPPNQQLLYHLPQAFVEEIVWLIVRNGFNFQFTASRDVIKVNGGTYGASAQWPLRGNMCLINACNYKCVSSCLGPKDMSKHWWWPLHVPSAHAVSRWWQDLTRL